MGTKREIIDEAFEELGLGGQFNVTPQEQQRALRRLESMVAQWQAKGMVATYVLPVPPAESALDDEAGLTRAETLALQLNLAIALAPSFGKMLPIETKTAAKAAYEDLLRVAVSPPQQALRAGLPLGAGNKTWRGYVNFTLDAAPDTQP